MWKYLILNSLWFLILFLVHFFGSQKDRSIVLVSIFGVAALLAFQGYLDPIAWFYYFVFSCLVFYGATDFKRRAFSELFLVTSEIDANLKEFKEVKNAVVSKTQQTQSLERRAEEIVEFYEQIKEMSKSLDCFETFLIFAEALSEYFEFKVVKLSIFKEKSTETLIHPEEVYELSGEHFQGIFDRSAFLIDKKKVRGEVFPFDQKIYSHLFEKRQPILLTDPKDLFYASPDDFRQPFAAYPIFIHKKMFAVLTLVSGDAIHGPDRRTAIKEWQPGDDRAANNPDRRVAMQELRPVDLFLFDILIDRFLFEMQRMKLYESVEMLAITDWLTGMYVRRYLIERLEKEWERSKRFEHKLSFFMLDIDHFKHINDEYGHLVGDTVLRQVAQTVKKNVRELDFAGRYGGEEFAVGLIETDEKTALHVAERIRKSIEKREFKAYGESLKITISIGCATCSPVFNSVNQLIEGADMALYQAKHLGRNQVCTAGC